MVLLHNAWLAAEKSFTSWFSDKCKKDLPVDLVKKDLPVDLEPNVKKIYLVRVPDTWLDMDLWIWIPTLTWLKWVLVKAWALAMVTPRSSKGKQWATMTFTLDWSNKAMMQSDISLKLTHYSKILNIPIKNERCKCKCKCDYALLFQTHGKCL